MKVKDLIKELSQLDQDAVVILYEGGENYPASDVESGEMVSGRTIDGHEFKPDSVSDDDFYDGVDKSLTRVLYKAVCIY
jgi:hypothetical protein